MDAFDLRRERMMFQQIPRSVEESFRQNISDWSSFQQKLSTVQMKWEQDWTNIVRGFVNEETTKMLVAKLIKSESQIIVDPVNQSSCNSCWAIVTALALTDRFRIALLDPTFPILSPSNLMGEAFRRKKKCCHGDTLQNALNYVDLMGLETWCCSPYRQMESCELPTDKETFGIQNCSNNLGVPANYGDEYIDETSLNCTDFYSVDDTNTRFHIQNSSYYELESSDGPVESTTNYLNSIKYEIKTYGPIICSFQLNFDFNAQTWLTQPFLETEGIYIRSLYYPYEPHIWTSEYIDNIPRPSTPEWDTFVDTFNTGLRAYLESSENTSEWNLYDKLWSKPTNMILYTLGISDTQSNRKKLTQFGVGLYPDYPYDNYILGNLEIPNAHAMTIVGWDKKTINLSTYTGKENHTATIPYWIVRNTWGKNSYHNGYAYIAFSTNVYSYVDDGAPYFLRRVNDNTGVDSKHYGGSVSNVLNLAGDPTKIPFFTNEESIPYEITDKCRENIVCGGLMSPGRVDTSRARWRLSLVENTPTKTDNIAVDTVDSLFRNDIHWVVSQIQNENITEDSAPATVPTPIEYLISILKDDGNDPDSFFNIAPTPVESAISILKDPGNDTHDYFKIAPVRESDVRQILEKDDDASTRLSIMKLYASTILIFVLFCTIVALWFTSRKKPSFVHQKKSNLIEIDTLYAEDSLSVNGS